MSDEIEFADLLERIRSGDQSAEGQLAQRFWRGMFFILYKQTGERNLSEDLAQEAMVIVLEKARRGLIDNPESLPSFVRQTCINILIGLRRKESRRNTHPDSESIDRFEAGSESLLAVVGREQAAGFVQKALDELSTDRDRDILRRHYLMDEDKVSTCAALGLSAAHYDRVLHRARQRLKQLLLSKADRSDPQRFMELVSVIVAVSVTATVLAYSDTEISRTAGQASSWQAVKHLHVDVAKQTTADKMAWRG